MQDAVLVPEGAPLSQAERVVDTFVAPSKTFTDILRNASWWLPFVLMLVVGVVSSTAIEKKVGFERVAEQQVESNPQAQDRLSQLTPEQRDNQIRISAKITRIVTYAFGVPLLIVASLATLGLWATFNFGLGARTTYGQMFAVWIYAGLPKSLSALLAAILLFANVNTEHFDIRNPIGTNLAYYMPDASPAIRAALSFFDIFGLWTLVLLILGTSIIARKSRSQAAAVVVGWWVLILLVSVGFAAAFG